MFSTPLIAIKKEILNPYYNNSQPFQKRATDFKEVQMPSITRLDQ